jgi:hypothetical protein
MLVGRDAGCRDMGALRSLPKLQAMGASAFSEPRVAALRMCCVNVASRISTLYGKLAVVLHGL